MDGLAALDKAVGVVNRALGDGRGGGPRPPRAGKPKWVSFSAAATATAPPAPARGPAVEGRGLDDYLALPVSAYSLLDPSWVTPAGEGGEEDDAFIVALPLADALGVALTPSARVRVADRSRGVVAFSGSDFTLGDVTLDAAFEAGVDARLRSVQPPRRHRRHRGGGDDAHHPHLAATVTLRARVRLQGAAAAVPGPVLKLAAKLVARAALGAALPAFLGMLQADAAAWCAGEARAWVGDGEDGGGGDGGGGPSDGEGEEGGATLTPVD